MLDKIITYISNQKVHHHTKSFKEEYVEILQKFEVEFNPKYLFEFNELIKFNRLPSPIVPYFTIRYLVSFPIQVKFDIPFFRKVIIMIFSTGRAIKKSVVLKK